MNVEQLWGNHRVIAVVDNQFGDTGKGKQVDLLAEGAGVVARGQGGANSGHTVKVGDIRLPLHLIPCGILRDKDGVTNFLGPGVAFDPRVFLEEVAALDKAGISHENLRVSDRAHLVLPQHIAMDMVTSGEIGTTARGIGPCYRDHIDRVGLTVGDLRNPDVFARKLKRNLERKRRFFAAFDPELVRSAIRHDRVGGGKYASSGNDFCDADAIISEYLAYGRALGRMICDTDYLVRQALELGKRILLEGAQGLLLSVDHGTYPFVTSSNSSRDGLALGAGVPPALVTRTFGMAKIYMTRVGEGPFPTELGGEGSASWCRRSEVNRDLEAKLYSDASVNNSDQFLQGVAIRQIGNEYGTTTGRPRRIGWLDLPLLRYAARFNGREIGLSMVDVLDGCEQIRFCRSYKYTGRGYHFNDGKLVAGSHLHVLSSADPDVLSSVEPVYNNLPGWMMDTRDARTWDDLPERLRDAVEFVEAASGVSIATISVGPDRDQTIIRPND